MTVTFQYQPPITGAKGLDLVGLFESALNVGVFSHVSCPGHLRQTIQYLQLTLKTLQECASFFGMVQTSIYKLDEYTIHIYIHIKYISSTQEIQFIIQCHVWSSGNMSISCATYVGSITMFLQSTVDSWWMFKDGSGAVGTNFLM
jgi:hypothetical protein